MDQKQRKVTTTLTNGQTQYLNVGGSSGARVERMNTLCWTVDHPAATTTTYTVQCSNLTDQEINLGQDDWADDNTVAAIPVMSAATKFGVKITKATFARYRLKGVTSAGGPAAVNVREQRKGA